MKERTYTCCSLCSMFSCDCTPEDDCRRPLSEEERPVFLQPKIGDFADSIKLKVADILEDRGLFVWYPPCPPYFEPPIKKGEEEKKKGNGLMKRLKNLFIKIFKRPHVCCSKEPPSKTSEGT